MQVSHRRKGYRLFSSFLLLLLQLFTFVFSSSSSSSQVERSSSHRYWEHETMSCYKPVVFCGPSGVGKGTLIEKLMNHFPKEQFGFSVSHTTRQPREGELHGIHYNFTTVEIMKEEIEQGKFIEYAEVHGRYYGTSIAAVDAVQKSGKICVLDIDVQGVQSVKESSLEPLYIFIAPPSMEILEQRLRGRGTEIEEQIQLRLNNAAQELEYGYQKGNFDKIFINQNLEECFTEMVQAFQEWYPHLQPVTTTPQQE